MSKVVVKGIRRETPEIKKVEQMVFKVLMDDGSTKHLIFDIKNGFVGSDMVSLEFNRDLDGESIATIRFNYTAYNLTIVDEENESGI